MTMEMKPMKRTDSMRSVMTKCGILKEEDGSVLIVALMILVILTMIGMIATSTTQFELRIAGNENVYKQNLYLADGASMGGAQMLENEPDPNVLKDAIPTWLHKSLPDPNISGYANWNPANNNSKQAVNTTNRYLAVHQGIAPGSSLDIGYPSSLHVFSVYGCSLRNNGESIVEIGYRRRF